MCQMPGTRYEEGLLDLDKGEIRRSWPGRSMAGKSAGAMVIELGITLAGAEPCIATPGWCLRCRVSQDPKRSTSQYPNVFCSEHCEEEFIRAALVSVTLEDCIRMQERLENLFVPAQETAAAQQDGVAMACKQLKHMAQLDASIQERDVETQVKSRYKAVEVAAPCAYREPEDVSRRLHRAEIQYDSQIEPQRRDTYQ